MTGPQTGSLGAKLFHLKVDEVMVLPDQEPPPRQATQMERQVGTLVAKSPYLHGRKYETTRCDMIVKRELVPMLLIRRTE